MPVTPFQNFFDVRTITGDRTARREDNHVYLSAALHTAAWLLYVLILLLGTDKAGRSFWINTSSTLIPIITLFYLNIGVLFPRFLQTGRYVLLAGLLMVLNLCTIGLRLLLVRMFNGAGMDDFIQGLFSPVAFWNQFRVNVLFIGISFAYWYAVKNYRSEKARQSLEREVLDARLQSLKHQINPHFLYNTLSFIYTRSLSYSAELAGSIARLSDMMRYSLGETESDGKVPLEKEIMHIENFIGIQQMRFDHMLNIDLQKSGDTQCRIMPLLLMTFVENACKHGKLNDPDHPLAIRLHASRQLVTFEIRNRTAEWKKETAHGIGLQNVRNRLELAYPGKHQLLITDAGEAFIVNLQINLQP